MAIYRYFSQLAHYDDFINHGKVYFNSLSHFISTLDPARADKTEVSIHHKPNKNLGINVINTGQSFPDQRFFVPRISKPDRMFVFCASRKLDDALFRKFNAQKCVEFSDLEEFKKRLARQITKLFNQAIIRNRTLISGIVEYYDHPDELKTKHACPDLILLSKPLRIGESNFAEEEEYRFAFAKDKNAFEVHDGLRVQNIIYTLESVPQPPTTNPTSIALTLGNLSDICKVAM
jgi:hypothetical protein